MFESLENIIRDTLLKLVDKMCKYEMHPASIVKATERTRFCPQKDGQADRRTDGQTGGQGETSIPPFNFVEAGVLRGYLCVTIHMFFIDTHLLHMVLEILYIFSRPVVIGVPM